MKQLERIQLIIENLKLKPCTIHDLLGIVADKESNSSIRQLQRDVKDVSLLLSGNEMLQSFRKNQYKYYFITTKVYENFNQDTYLKTNFYVRENATSFNCNLNTIDEAIKASKLIVISKVLNDETGDNNNFETKNIYFQPLHIILHRNSYFVGGYNTQKKCVQIFGIDQIENATLSSQAELLPEINEMFDFEFNKRFGVTKNIDEETHKIVLEISAVLAKFFQNHHWHHSQKFTKQNGKTLMFLECGINRELLGWLFQWMYNIKIIEPPVLKEYYEKTLTKISSNNKQTTPLVYRNIF